MLIVATGGTESQEKINVKGLAHKKAWEDSLICPDINKHNFKSNFVFYYTWIYAKCVSVVLCCVVLCCVVLWCVVLCCVV